LVARLIAMCKFRLFIFTLALLAGFSSFGLKHEPAFKNGDLIFIVNPSGQGKAIQLATRSNFTHVGIIFIENGKPMVYHAVEPVSKNSLEEFVDMSVDDHYEIRRLKDQTLLTPTRIAAMLQEARSKLGVHYDLAFNWSDEELYCSEFVWKLYDHALKIHIGDLKPLKSFDLSHPAGKTRLEQRYGKNIPYNENMISPGDMYTSVLLE
jgi:hypothetical protein